MGAGKRDPPSLNGVRKALRHTLVAFFQDIIKGFSPTSARAVQDIISSSENSGVDGILLTSMNSRTAGNRE